MFCSMSSLLDRIYNRHNVKCSDVISMCMIKLIFLFFEVCYENYDIKDCELSLLWR